MVPPKARLRNRREPPADCEPTDHVAQGRRSLQQRLGEFIDQMDRSTPEEFEDLVQHVSALDEEVLRAIAARLRRQLGDEATEELMPGISSGRVNHDNPPDERARELARLRYALWWCVTKRHEQITLDLMRKREPRSE